MARYKIVDRSPRFLPVVLEAQLMSGSFEYPLDYLIDQQLDLSRLDRRYHNDATGCSAYDPRVLLRESTGTDPHATSLSPGISCKVR